MLILTRRPGEAVMIGKDIIVTVLGCHGGQVRIGINAPQNGSIGREKIRARKVDAHVTPPGRSHRE